MFSGLTIAENGSHEALVYSKVPAGEGGIAQPDLIKAAGANAKIGMAKAIQAGWVKIQKADGVTKLIRNVDSIEDTVSFR